MKRLSRIMCAVVAASGLAAAPSIAATTYVGAKVGIGWLDSAFVREQLLQMKEEYPVIGDIRGIGLLWGVELVTDHITKTRAFDEAEAVLYQCLNEGLSFKVSQGNVIQLSPPLIISRNELEVALSVFEKAIAKVCKDFEYL